MYREPTPEEEEKLLNKIAEYVIKTKMVSPAILTLDMLKPLGTLSGQFGQLLIVPFLPFNEEEISLIIDILGKTENIEKLIKKIEILNIQNKENGEHKNNSFNLFNRIKEKIYSIFIHKKKGKG